MTYKNIAIIDADLITGKKHRFPNLVSMKLSGYYKDSGTNVKLITSYNEFESDAYDKIYLSKVFTDTVIPQYILNLPNIECGGTGFYYENAPELSYDIEHHMPDYHLYDAWVNAEIQSGKSATNFKYFTDYSIGYTSRYCMRGCKYCVNVNKTKSIKHSDPDEFVDKSRKYICLLDDNVLACKEWKDIFHSLQETGKKFQFKQGLDERLLNDEKCIELFNKSKWVGDYIFAFDNIDDKDIIIDRLKKIRQYTNKVPKFYCFCGYDRNGKWDNAFYEQEYRFTILKLGDFQLDL